ncbi:LysM peptidoglycan-binding domain-containing protein [Ectothiorhodospiraceae bacterium 2226]|nr:LysM peptidoglycan-binding domain-containing protein [Ectothiorhodospiraceae bacterium 2226]
MAPAAAPELRSDPPNRYTVVRGDTLWDISSRFLRDPWRWPEVWHVNPQVENPHLIYPGDVITLRYIDGKPVLEVQRGRPVVRLSPEAREMPRDASIAAIPLEAIRPFLSRPRVLNPGELDGAPYVLSMEEGRFMGAAGTRFYARGLAEDVGRYTVLREGQVYRHPVTDEVLGLEALHVGDAHVQRVGDPGTLHIDSARREVLRGDRLLPAEADPWDHRFVPRAPERAVEGHIIAVMDGVTQIGQHQVVVLDLGEREGMEPGHVMAVYQRGAVMRDEIARENVRLPDERAGELMVFRVFDRVSYALIMRASGPMRVLDNVRMP